MARPYAFLRLPTRMGRVEDIQKNYEDLEIPVASLVVHGKRLMTRQTEGRGGARRVVVPAGGGGGGNGGGWQWWRAAGKPRRCSTAPAQTSTQKAPNDVAQPL